MQEVKERKRFAEPELIKCKEPLDHVTMATYSGGGSGGSSSSSGGDHCTFFETLFQLNHCHWD